MYGNISIQHIDMSVSALGTQVNVLPNRLGQPESKTDASFWWSHSLRQQPIELYATSYVITSNCMPHHMWLQSV